MRHLSPTIPLLALILVLSCGQSAQPSTAIAPEVVEWYAGSEGYAEAIRDQKLLHSALVVYFYADWCPYCRRLDREILPSPEMSSFLKHAVRVRLNPENGPEERRLADVWGVTGYPAFFVVSGKSGTPVKLHPFPRVQGKPVAVSPQEFATSCWRAADLVPPSTRQGVTDSYRGLGKSVETSVRKAAGAATGNRSGTGTKPDSRTSRTRATPAGTTSFESAKIDASGPLPTVDQVLEHYLQAIGGVEAVTKPVSRVAKGTVAIPGVSNGGTFELHAKRPNKNLVTMNVYPLGVVRLGYNGVTGWQQTARTASRNLSGTELASVARDSDFYSQARMKVNYPKMRLLGKTSVGYREVYVLDLRSTVGDFDRLYFEAQSGLPIRMDAARITPQGKQPATVYFDDWREVDGLKMPFRVTQSFGNTTLVFVYEEVRHNIRVDDRIFDKPTITNR